MSARYYLNFYVSGNPIACGGVGRVTRGGGRLSRSYILHTTSDKLKNSNQVDVYVGRGREGARERESEREIQKDGEGGRGIQSEMEGQNE